MNEKTCGCPGSSTCPSVACIHTKRILDSCLDKDCIEDLRVYLTKPSQQVLDRSTAVKVRSAELLQVAIDVEPAAYKQGCYSLDLTFYYRVLSDATAGCGKPDTLLGLAVFGKRVVLYGGTGCTKLFTSGQPLTCCNPPDLPQAVVEALDPMILSARVVELCDQCRCEPVQCNIPPAILACFDGELVLSGAAKKLLITIGQFSTLRLERDAQLRIGTLEYCIPEQGSCDDVGTAEDPCQLFGRIAFPTEAFYPTNCPPAEGCGVCFDETGC